MLNFELNFHLLCSYLFTSVVICCLCLWTHCCRYDSSDDQV